MCNRSGRDITSLPCDIDRDSLLRHRGMTIPQRSKPVAMVKGNVLHTLPQQQQQQQDPLKPSDISADKCLSEVRVQRFLLMKIINKKIFHEFFY